MRNDTKGKDGAVLSDNCTDCIDNYQTGNMYRKYSVLNLLRVTGVVRTIPVTTSAFNAQIKGGQEND